MESINRRKIFPILLIFLLSLLPLLNLLHEGLPLTHDGLDHVARVANFYKNLTQGIFIPRWAPDLNWGFGHPILMFLYPLPSYASSLFHLIGFSYIDSLKLVFGVSYVLSGIFMYLWLGEFLDGGASMLGGILYLFAPYRFIDLYVRGAFGEHVAFVFLPLVLYTLYNLNKVSNKARIRNYYLQVLFVAICFAALVLSHNAISLLFIPFVIFYIFYLYLENKSKIKLALSFLSLFYGFLFSFFFWFPAFMEGRYTLRDIVTSGEYLKRFVEGKALLYGAWSFGGTGQFSVQIGIVHILLTVLSILLFFKLFKRANKQRYLLAGTLIIFISSVFLMLPASNLVWHKLAILQKLQFPWRFLSIVVFATSVLGAIFVAKINLKNKKILTFILIAVSVLITLPYWHARDYKTIPNNFFETTYEGTTDTGESSPIWSIRFMEKRAVDEIEVIDGHSSITKGKRLVNYHSYVVSATQRTRLRENTLYFPGWKVYDNGKLVENIEFQDPKNRGIITFYVNAGRHDIALRFEDTKLRKFANTVSLGSILFSLFLIGRLKLKK